MRLPMLIAAMAFMAIAACTDKEGPAERLGERVDDAVDEARDRLDDARDEARDAADDVRDTLRGEQ